MRLESLDVLRVFLEFGRFVVQGQRQSGEEAGGLFIWEGFGSNEDVADEVAVLENVPRIAQLLGLAPGLSHHAVLPA